MMGVALAHKPDGYGSPREGYPLWRVFDLMDAWREDVECWGLHQMCRVLREAYEEAAGAFMEESDNADRLHDQVQRVGREIGRALDAIPCAEGRTDCGARGYPWFSCCKLRGALWFGEPFPTDHLPDEGHVHRFEPPDPACPNAPRKSAGCVRLIEPVLPEDQDWIEE